MRCIAPSRSGVGLIRRFATALMVSCGIGVASTAVAVPVMWVHDSDGTLARVDVPTGAVTTVGQMPIVMTDIAFSPTGALYGVSFTALYSIDTTTAVATLVGNLGVNSMNALVFGADGTLYGAANATNNLYSINTSTGAATNLGSTGFSSGGDLAFYQGDLYLADGSSRLVRINLANLGASSLIGTFGVGSMFGLATGDDGVLYGVANRSIYSINAGTGAATLVSTFNNAALGQAFGQSFFTESGAPDPDPPGGVPAPGSLVLIAGALLAMGALRRR